MLETVLPGVCVTAVHLFVPPPPDGTYAALAGRHRPVQPPPGSGAVSNLHVSVSGGLEGLAPSGAGGWCNRPASLAGDG